MKTNKMFRRFVALLLSSILAVGYFGPCAPTASAAGVPETTRSSQDLREQLLEFQAEEVPQLKTGHRAEDNVTIIVELEGESLLAQDGDAQQLSALTSSHDRVKRQIAAMTGSASVSSLDGGEFGFDYYVVMNGFSVTTQYRYLEQIRALEGVKSAYVEQTYEKPREQAVTPQMFASAGMIGAGEANDSGFTGKGMAVAVLDTGLDVNHEAFSTAPESPKYTREEMGALLAAGKLSAQRAVLRKVYVSEKIPFVYDYADGDTDVYPHTGDSHGTHVSGTVAANGEKLTGVAPDAQLMMLKVFRDEDGGAADSYLLAALDDAVKLGADAINMSLGAPCGFTDDGGAATQAVYARIREAGILLAISAGNETNTALGNNTGVDRPFAEDPDYGILGSPSTSSAAMSVASMVNEEISGMSYFVAEGRKIFYTEVSLETDPKLGDLDGEYSYVYCGYGRPEDFTEAGYVQGKVALVSRGENSFDEKVQNAYAAGAAAVVVMNNQSGTIAMSVNRYVIPAVSITRADGVFLRERSVCRASFDPAYVGSMVSPTAYQMSTFSSWGPTPDLKLKPEITAPGENIYSSVPGDTYVSMSGTSMAAPHIAGAFAALKQYVAETYPTLSAAQQYALVNSLLMSTATPAMDPDGQYVSPRKQGAGLANLADAISAQAYLTTSTSDKPKAELGYQENGYYTFGVTLHNLSGEDKVYTPDTAALIEQVEDGLFTFQCQDRAGNGITVSYAGLDSQGRVTVPAGGEAQVTVSLQVEQALRQELKEICPAGNYVEGFVRFLSEDEVDLTVPFLGFYGDWAAPKVFDAEYGVADYHFRPSIVFNAVYDNATFLGQNVIESLLTGETTVDPTRYVISPNSFGSFCSILSTQTGILRNAKKMTYTITNQKTGQVVQSFTYDDVRKSYYYQQTTYTWAEAFFDTIPTFDGHDMQGRQVPEGTYTYTVRAYPDGLKEPAYDEWSFNFAYDATPASLADYRFFEEDGKSYVTLTVKDNFFLSGLQVQLDPEHLAASVATIDPDTREDGSYVTDAEGNRIYTVTMELTELYRELEEAEIVPSTLYVALFDYAMNLTTLEVPLEDVPADGVTLDRTAVHLVPGMTAALAAHVTPDGASDYTLTWSSSDDSVATVENGAITAQSIGQATITATVQSQGKRFDASCQVTVTENPGVAIDPTEMTLTEGERAQVQVALLPGLGNGVTFRSSDEQVAVVDASGLVTARAAGEAIITASSVTDPTKTAQMQLHVTAAPSDFLVEDGVLLSYTGSETEIVIPDTVRKIGSGVLGYSSPVTKVVIPASVTEIGDSAFSYRQNLQTVVIQGNGLRRIGNYAFASTSIRQITIPDGVTEIGSYAFSQTYLESVVIPDSVTELGDHVFFYCGSLRSAVLPDTITVLKDATFWMCGSLVELRLPKYLKELGQSSLYGTSLPTLDLPQTLEIIGEYALADNLYPTIVLPENVRVLGSNALQGSYLAKEIVLNDKLEEIGDRAFQACYSLERVVFGASVSSVGTNLFYASTGLRDVEVSEKNPFFTGRDGVLYSKDGTVLYAYAPGKLDERFVVPSTVQEIKPYAFTEVDSLCYVDLPDGLQSIGDHAFAKMADLKEVILPDSVTELGAEAYTHCPSVETVRVGSGVEVIPSGCFDTNESLASLTLCQGLREIRSNAFSNAEEITQLVLPESLEKVEYSAFMSCDNLKQVQIPATLRDLSTSAFNFCQSLEEYQVSPENENYRSEDGVLFSKDLRTMLSYPSGRQGESYTVPEGVEIINSYAFTMLSHLTKVVLPEGVKELKDYAFYNSGILQEVNFPDSLQTMGFGTAGYSDIRVARLGKQIQTLPFGTFMSNPNLRLVDFSRCDSISLNSFCIGAPGSLRTVIAGDNVTSLGWTSFDTNENTVIYAPADSLFADYARNNNRTFVALDGFTVIPDVEKTDLSLGESLTVHLLTVEAQGAVRYHAALTEKYTGAQLQTLDAEQDQLTVTPASAGILELTVTAEDEAGSKTTSVPLTITVNDGNSQYVDWKTGDYTVPVGLYDLAGQNLLDESQTLGEAVVHVDADGLTLHLPVANGKAISYAGSEGFLPAELTQEGAFRIPLERYQFTVQITYADGSQISGTLKLDVRNAVYRQQAQETVELADGLYQVDAAFYRMDWEEEAPASALLKQVYLRADHGSYQVLLETQPWTPDGQSETRLEGLSLLAETGEIPAKQVQGADAFYAPLPHAVPFTPVLLRYVDESGAADLPRAARLYLDLEHAEPMEGHAPIAGERRNAKAPTCTEDGYTGDLVCVLCGEVMEQGRVIPANCPSKAFADLDINRWYHPYTDYVIQRGLMKGMDEKTFAPNGDLTRGMLVTTLYRLAGSPTVTAPSSFVDVPTGRYYTDAVSWAQASGIAKGMDQTHFAPDSKVTREQASVFLYRYVTEYRNQAPGKGADLSQYTDAGEISRFAREAMAWATAAGLLQGYGDGTVGPRNSLTRAQMAKFLTILDQKF